MKIPEVGKKIKMIQAGDGTNPFYHDATGTVTGIHRRNGIKLKIESCPNRREYIGTKVIFTLSSVNWTYMLIDQEWNEEENEV